MTELNLNVNQNNSMEFYGQLIDEVDDFLEEQNIVLPRSREELIADDEYGEGNSPINHAIVYGSDYDELQSRFEKVIHGWEKEREVVLTRPAGAMAVAAFITEWKEKRKELLDAGKDMAGDITTPTIDDIIADIEAFDEPGDYVTSWSVTKNYDLPIHLREGIDYYFKSPSGSQYYLVGCGSTNMAFVFKGPFTSVNKVQEALREYVVDDLQNMNSKHSFRSKIVRQNMYRLYDDVYREKSSHVFSDGMFEVAENGRCVTVCSMKNGTSAYRIFER